MINLYLLFLTPFFLYYVNSIFLKKKLLPNYSGSNHQKFFNNKHIPLSGGPFLFFFSLFIFFDNLNIFLFALFLIFLLGFLSDINFLSSVKWRFLFQSIIIFFPVSSHLGCKSHLDPDKKLVENFKDVCHTIFFFFKSNTISF